MFMEIIDDSLFVLRVLRNPKTICVIWSAPWCAPCAELKKKIEALTKLSNCEIEFVIFNIDTQVTPNLRHIKMIPTLTLFKDGQEVRRHAGAGLSVVQLKEFLAL